jgi:hypothetical protein
VPILDGITIKSAVVRNKDRSSEHLAWQAGSELLAASHSFYPPQPGEDFLRPHITTVYDPKGGLLDEDVRHLDRTREKWTHVSPQGLKRILSYAADGQTILGDESIDLNLCCDDDMIRSLKRWRDEPGHSLEYENTLNGDLTRTLINYDRHHNPLRVELRAPVHSLSDTTILVYDPETLKLRIKSETKGEYDIADLYGDSGVRMYTLKLSDAATFVTSYNDQGVIPLFEQEFCFEFSTENGVSIMRRLLSSLTEFDSVGKRKRLIDMDLKGGITSEERFDVVLDGVTYGQALYYFNPDGTLRQIKYYRKDEVESLLYKPDRQVDFAQSDIRFVPPAPDELVLKVKIDDLGLPVPRSYGDGH